MDKKIESIIKLIAFRRQMGMALEREKVARFWGNNALSEVEKVLVTLASKQYMSDADHAFLLSRTEVLKGVSEIVEKMWYLNRGALFIGVSGSLAAGTYKDGDDIDIFVVVKDYYAWIYRAFVKFCGRKIVRNFGDEELSNKLCINFICEERGLNLENQDIFTLHELLYLEPVYKKEYYDTLLQRNQWMRTKYNLILPEERETLDQIYRRRPILSRVANNICMWLQLFYMILNKHGANIDKIRKDYSKGKIMFYPENFNSEATRQYEVELRNIRNELMKIVEVLA